jgi:dTDP-4-dehydrorhamnose 3,5-epimerase
LIFHPLSFSGVILVELEPIEDERGWFARTWCAEEFGDHGIATRWAQSSVSANRAKGTLRGLHYQCGRHAEAKLIRCSRGSLFDVAIDLRPASRTYRQWLAVELSAAAGNMLYLPEGVAHGYQTLEDETEVTYQISTGYCPESARGIRWNDPAFAIQWPLPAPILSARDAAFPDFVEVAYR